MIQCVLSLVAAIAPGQKPEPPPITVVAITHPEPVSFEKEVAPILAAKCTVCHAGNVQRGKLDMGGMSGLLKGGVHGPALVPGKSAESLLVQRGGRTVKPAMPPKDEEPLTPQELALIKIWIDQGAKVLGT